MYILFINFYAVNLFNKADHSIVDTTTGFDAEKGDLQKTDGTQKNYYIYDCENGKCKQTSGYIQSGGEVIAFIGEGSEGHANLPIVKSKSCVDNEIGRVTKDKKSICYTAGKIITFGSYEPSRNIIEKGKALAITPFEDNENNVVIKHGEGYIVRDKFFTSRNYFA